MTTNKTAVLLLNLGGPDSLQAVKPFMYNLFADPDIFNIPLGAILQKPLAWIISNARHKNAVESYRLIGGRSPILPLTEAQAQALEAELNRHGHDLPVYIGMRYWHPFMEDALRQMVKDGIERLILLPLYPQYSLTTTGSSVNELERLMNRHPELRLPYTLIPQYHTHPEYQAALTERIQDGLERHIWNCPPEEVTILFSAHSLPKRFVDKTGDIYPRHIQETCEALMESAFRDNPWHLCFQSKIGKIPWLQPYTEDVIDEFAEKGVENVLMVPISFVSDHIETLYEIDLLYLPQAYRLGMKHYHRVESLNDQPRFIQALAHLVRAEVHQHRPAVTAP